MHEFHDGWFLVAVIAAGGVGVWGVVLAARRQAPGRAFLTARWVAVAAMLIQVAAGVILYAQGERPADGLHVFYGVLVAITLAFAYVFRAALARRPALAYGLLLLFVMGLGLRAWGTAG
ncbi:MAG: hypothetical protein PVI35_07395 [Acidimicrobiia bacterium]|jgi:hypothetical protein